jgi:hypothetical protein
MEDRRMERSRLKSATTAERSQIGVPKSVAVVIPARSEVSADPIDTRARLDRSEFIAVKWAGTMVQMFGSIFSNAANASER